MMRVPIWVTAFMFVAGASLAAPSVEGPVRAPRSERPTPSGDWSLQQLERTVEAEVAAEEVQIARHGRGGGGRRGGARSRSRGGFRAGNKRQSLRGGELGRPGRVGDPGGIRGGVHRDVDIDRNVGIHRDVDIHRGVGVVGGRGVVYGGGDWDDDDDELEAALLGGVVGMGVGALINDSQY